MNRPLALRAVDEQGGARRWRIALLLLIAAGLQFQFILPMGSTGLKLSPADPLALAAALLVAVHALRSRQAPLRPEFKPVWLALPVAALTLGLITAYLRYGQLSSWALVGKYAGWFALMAYFAAGAGLVGWLGGDARRRSLRLFCWLAVLATAVFYLPRLFYVFYLELPPPFVSLPYWMLQLYDNAQASPVDNDNATAVILLCVLALVLGHRIKGSPLFGPAAALAVGVLAGLGIVLSSSRSGMGAALLLFLAAFVVSRECRTFIAAILAVLALYYGAANITDGWSRAAGELNRSIPQRQPAPDGKLDTSVTGRLNTSGAALQMFEKHPLVGSGLGGFLQERRAEGLVIHNTVLWIAAELGLVGLAAFAAFAAVVIGCLVRLAREPGSDGAMAVSFGLIIVGVGAMAMAHELLYQRVPWFLLGMTLAGSGTAARSAAFKA